MGRVAAAQQAAAALHCRERAQAGHAALLVAGALLIASAGEGVGGGMPATAGVAAGTEQGAGVGAGRQQRAAVHVVRHGQAQGGVVVGQGVWREQAVGGGGAQAQGRQRLRLLRGQCGEAMKPGQRVRAVQRACRTAAHARQA